MPIQISNFQPSLTGSMQLKEELSVERTAALFSDETARYQLSGRDFSRQFYHVYSSRLKAVEERLRAAAAEKWGGVAVVAVSELDEERAECAVIGTLFKQQQLKPSILKEISEEHNLMPQPPRERFISDSDHLILEDEGARIRLEGNIDPQQYVNGVVCAVVGREEVSGKFKVRDVCFPDLPPQEVDRPIPDKDSYVLLVSGLGLEASGNLFLAQLLVDLVTGQLGSEEEQKEMAAVCRVIVAGNSLSASSRDSQFLKRAAYLTSDLAGQSAAAVRSLDELLQQLTASCDLDLMPGEFDPTNHLLPQRPMHPCLLPKAAAYRTFHGVTNPYQAVVGGRRLLGSSGQNVHDLYRYSACDDPLTSLERLLTWGHLCPTAPDTLTCYPYYDKDPFTIDQCPDLLFAGNQTKFATKMCRGSQGQRVRLLCLPEFHRTATCALVNLRTLGVRRITLGSVLTQNGEEAQPEK
ncbi:DNA polymerase delta subunit 2 [Amphibalanus amphitrite]|uniref:DNA polymerase delta subunit 2 n=1 Tax=Amphibalanus amphitrite TaxID=1232801 RepID=A0A6A4WX77_AMPAM|nr:DNA polymerase delta subunit 2 [Amphibalanus amphitrite]